MAFRWKAAYSVCMLNSSEVLFLEIIVVHLLYMLLPISSHRILKRCIFKYQDLIKFIILLHQGWSSGKKLTCLLRGTCLLWVRGGKGSEDCYIAGYHYSSSFHLLLLLNHQSKFQHSERDKLFVSTFMKIVLIS